MVFLHIAPIPTAKLLHPVVLDANAPVPIPKLLYVGVSEPTGPVEPDARKYECDCCGEPKVYGAEELIMMGLYH